MKERSVSAILSLPSIHSLEGGHGVWGDSRFTVPYDLQHDVSALLPLSLASLEGVTLGSHLN